MTSDTRRESDRNHAILAAGVWRLESASVLFVQMSHWSGGVGGGLRVEGRRKEFFVQHQSLLHRTGKWLSFNRRLSARRWMRRNTQCDGKTFGRPSSRLTYRSAVWWVMDKQDYECRWGHKLGAIVEAFVWHVGRERVAFSLSLPLYSLHLCPQSFICLVTHEARTNLQSSALT